MNDVSHRLFGVQKKAEALLTLFQWWGDSEDDLVYLKYLFQQLTDDMIRLNQTVAKSQ
jgi:hypothetical protein